MYLNLVYFSIRGAKCPEIVIPFLLNNIPFFVGRVEARNPTGIDCGYQVGFRASTRPTEEWSKNN